MQNWNMLGFQELRTEEAALTIVSLEREMLWLPNLQAATKLWGRVNAISQYPFLRAAHGT
jgi:hypothetical protein